MKQCESVGSYDWCSLSLFTILLSHCHSEKCLGPALPIKQDSLSAGEIVSEVVSKLIHPS